MNEQKSLMKTIQTYSFVLVETVLYLDTHPYCRQAIRHYNKYKKLYDDAVRLYEEKFGPLTIKGNESSECWNWATDPWPWEI